MNDSYSCESTVKGLKIRNLKVLISNHVLHSLRILSYPNTFFDQNTLLLVS
jgi:hypothetical protein